MKTKYIKVPVSERLPEKGGNYFVGSTKGVNTSLFLGGVFVTHLIIEYWLEEVPDREDEMGEALQKSLDFIEEIAMLIPADWPESFRDYYNKNTNEIETLLNTLK